MISVIIPTYNEERYISECLTALTSQDVPADEIIVVNNNSTDKTVEIAKKFKVRIVNEKEQGMIAARNRGFNEAAGDIIARCDADCKPPKNWIAEIKKSFSEHSIDALTGPLVYDSQTIESSTPSLIYGMVVKLLLGGKQPLFGPNMALKKTIWNKIHDTVCMKDEDVHEDIDLSIHIVKARGIILFDNNCVMNTSSRRIKSNPFSFFGEYPLRTLKTVCRTHLTVPVLPSSPVR
jgi:glycosyltransferase involved in cell wall biosynthesis